MVTLYIIIFGVIIGAFADLFFAFPKEPGGLIVLVLLGIAGSLIGGFACRAFELCAYTLNGPLVIASILGAVVMVTIYYLVVRRKR